MSQTETIHKLITTLLHEEARYEELEIPSAYEDKRRLLRSLMNVRPPRPISEEFLKLQDEFLSRETKEKGIVDASLLPAVSKDSRICLWQGDITTLKIDAIVNAANDRMLGCFVPCHACIDNAIHSAAGVQLRLECDRIMHAQGYVEPTGTAKITQGYNLPCKYVLHTVGPIIQGHVTRQHKEELADCYRSCLELAVKNGLRSIAFCCISTGEFHFPQKLAAEIALKTVSEFLESNGKSIERIVFNVFKQEDYDIYKKLLG